MKVFIFIILVILVANWNVILAQNNASNEENDKNEAKQNGTDSGVDVNLISPKDVPKNIQMKANR